MEKNSEDKSTLFPADSLGFPCQPFSHAGKRKGTEDDRHLWPEMLRIIKEIQPHFIVGENVCGFITWNDGLVFEQVFSDLENEGYEVTAFVLPACAINAPHRRDRVWIVANAKSNRWSRRNLKRSEIGKRSISNLPEKRSSIRSEYQGCCRERISPDFDEFNGNHSGFRTSKISQLKEAGIFETERWKTQSPICGINDGISNRLDRIKALGNAIVPQVAYQIFKALDQLK